MEPAPPKCEDLEFTWVDLSPLTPFSPAVAAPFPGCLKGFSPDLRTPTTS